MSAKGIMTSKERNHRLAFLVVVEVCQSVAKSPRHLLLRHPIAIGFELHMKESIFYFMNLDYLTLDILQSPRKLLNY